MPLEKDWRQKLPEPGLKAAEKLWRFSEKGMKSLDDIRPRIYRQFVAALERAVGFSIDDPKGEHESNSFGAMCHQIQLEIVQQVRNLERAIQSEDAKQPRDRKKRLRVLIDFLAEWWKSETGQLTAPYVVANRRDGGTAVVHGRQGELLSLAVALFGEVDRFKESEIISAVINLHKIAASSKKREMTRHSRIGQK